MRSTHRQQALVLRWRCKRCQAHRSRGPARQGYVEAAHTFETESGTPPGVDLDAITDRMEIRRAVQSGNVEEAIERVNDLNPEARRPGPWSTRQPRRPYSVRPAHRPRVRLLHSSHAAGLPRPPAQHACLACADGPTRPQLSGPSAAYQQLPAQAAAAGRPLLLGRRARPARMPMRASERRTLETRITR